MIRKRRRIPGAVLALTLTATLLVRGGPGEAQQVATFPRIGEWSTAHLSRARTGMAATSVGTLALFAGGFSDPLGHAPASTVDIYDSVTGQWRTASLSGSRWGLAATSAGSQALFAGGPINTTQPVPTDVVDVYDAAAGGWSTAKLSQPRWGVGATSVGSVALFAGGIGASGDSAVVDLYDAATGRWSTATLSQARLRPAATSVGSLALFAGGAIGGIQPSDVVDIYDGATGVWSTAKLPHPRASAAAASVGTRALFAGGADVDVFDAATKQWSTMALPHPGTGLAATAVGTTVLFAGGRTEEPLTYTGVDLYESATGEWSTVRLSQPRSGLAATSAGTVALLAGGAAAGPLSDAVDQYESAPAGAQLPQAPPCASEPAAGFGLVWRTQPWVRHRLGCPVTAERQVTVRERRLETAPGARGYWVDDDSADWFELTQDSLWSPRGKGEQPWSADAGTALAGSVQRFDGGTMLWLRYSDRPEGTRRRVLVLAATPAMPGAGPGWAGEWRELPDPLDVPAAPSPIASVQPRSQPCPQATPELFWVDPVTSPTDQLTQDVSVHVGQMDQVLIVTESGTFGFTSGVSGNPVSVRVTLLPNTTHHLYVIARVKTIVKSGGDLDGCVYGGYTLTAANDRSGAPLTIVQSQVPHSGNTG